MKLLIKTAPFWGGFFCLIRALSVDFRAEEWSPRALSVDFFPRKCGLSADKVDSPHNAAESSRCIGKPKQTDQT
jgi:hypothetical protein